MDLMQAFLRLAPDGRREALADAGALRGEAGAAARFALGGEETPGELRGFWIAAARARDPFGEFPVLLEKYGEPGPDMAMPAHYAWEFVKPVDYSQMKSTLFVKVTPPPQGHIDCPTVLLHCFRETFWAMGSVLEIRCGATVWPANQEPTFVRGACAIHSRLNSPASALSPTAPYLEPLLDQDVPLGPMACLAVVMGLVSKDAGTKGMTLDVLIAAIADGRCDGKDLGELLARLSQNAGVIRLNRVAEGLSEIARAGLLHQYAAATLADAFLGTCYVLKADIPSDIHHLLAPLREWLTALGSGLGQDARAFLQTIGAGGKTGSLAKALVAMPASSALHRQVILEALRGRIERARCWMKRQ
jgi:hypothetical protein